MQIELPPWPEFVLFTLAVLVIAAFVIAAAGHFPHEHRKPGLATPAGAVILWLTVVAVAVAGVATVAFAGAVLPWYAAVISAGLMVLIAPYLLHPLPDWFLDGRWALVGLSGLGLILVAAMWSMI